jgi:hypothetical protein
MERLIKE